MFAARTALLEPGTDGPPRPPR